MGIRHVLADDGSRHSFEYDVMIESSMGIALLAKWGYCNGFLHKPSMPLFPIVPAKCTIPIHTFIHQSNQIHAYRYIEQYIICYKLLYIQYIYIYIYIYINKDKDYT
jgi:hypothetical protein